MNYPVIDWPYTNVHQLNLDWVLEALKKFHAALIELNQQTETNTKDIAELQAQVSALEKLIKQIEDGGFNDLYLSAIQKWVDENLPQIVHDLVKYVMFGLTLDGHFCAVIPEAWNFLSFDTVADVTSDLYGHLVLRW